MKQVVGILIGAALLFMALSIAQEWETFQPFFAGKRTPSGETIPAEAEETLKTFNTVLTHLYRFGPDERFFDRLPASDGIKEGIGKDLTYLHAYHVIQEMRLLEMTVLSRAPAGNDTYLLTTEESWELLYRDPVGKPTTGKPMHWAVTMRYRIRKTLTGWKIVSMEPEHG